MPDYDFTQIGRRPPIESVVWFGAAPGPSENTDGGTCSTAYATKWCVATINTNFGIVAGKYGTTEVNGTLAGGVDRTVDIDWTPSTATGHYFLDAFAHRFSWDGGGSVPTGSNGTNVVRQYFDFDTTIGFLNGAWTWDSVMGSAVRNCFYSHKRADMTADGTPLNDYSLTYSSATEPTSDSCGSIPSTGIDGDAFGQEHTSIYLLLTQTDWRKGTATIGWNSFEAFRDGSTGFLLESRDPN